MDDQQGARELLPLPSKEVIDVHLPTGVRIYGYTKEQMQSYAADCVTAALRAAPEGFVLAGYCHHLPGDNEAVGLFNKQTKHATIPLYTRPQRVK